MQTRSVAVKIFRLTSLVIFLLVFFISPSRVGAQYGEGAYGDCAYGETCPTEDQVDGEGNSADPGDDTLEEEPPAEEEPTENSGNAGSGTGTGRGRGTGSGTGANDTGPIKNEVAIFVLRAPVQYVKKLTPTQQAFLPYYLWILLLILAGVLLVQAYLDRHKTKKLKLLLARLQQAEGELKTYFHLLIHHLNTPVTLIRSSLELLAGAGGSDAEQVKKLTTASTVLATSIASITEEQSSEVVQSTDAVANAARRYNTWRERAYYIVPIVVALVFGLWVSLVLYQAEVLQSVHKIQYQIAVIFASTLIFFNAVRMYRISKVQRRILEQSRIVAEDLRSRRDRSIERLSAELEIAITNLTYGVEKITNEKYKELFKKGVDDIARIYTRARASIRFLTIDTTSFNIKAYIDEAISNIKSRAAEKSVMINHQLELPEQIVTHVDDVQFVIGAVLENSLQYSPDQTSVDLKGWMDGNRMHLTFADQGVGMSKEELEHVFLPFHKESNDVLQFDSSGASLSLFAVKQTVERLGGVIKINSVQQKGTTVEIELPVGY